MLLFADQGVVERKVHQGDRPNDLLRSGQDRKRRGWGLLKFYSILLLFVFGLNSLEKGHPDEEIFEVIGTTFFVWLLPVFWQSISI
jgi:hypothetical protein